jgi:hypothetical protein
MRFKLKTRLLIIAAGLIAASFILFFVATKSQRGSKLESLPFSTKYFQVSVPTNWKVESIKTLNSGSNTTIRTVDAIIISSPFDSESDTYSENMTLELKRSSNEMDLETLKQGVIKQISSQFQNAILGNEGNGTLNGNESKWFVVSYKLKEDCVLSRIHLVGICDTLTYIIVSSARCQEFDKYGAIFDSALASFHNLTDCNVAN